MSPRYVANTGSSVVRRNCCVRARPRPLVAPGVMRANGLGGIVEEIENWLMIEVVQISFVYDSFSRQQHYVMPSSRIGSARSANNRKRHHVYHSSLGLGVG